MPAEVALSGAANLVVALRAEAQPIIERFGLAPVTAAAFPTFATRAGDLGLVISGIGRPRAAAAVAHLAAGERDAAWLNVGIAGHRDLSLGSHRLAHKIRCHATGRAWYPPIVFEPPCATASLRTVDAACVDFPTADLYDMEGAGFYEIAARYSPHELIHALKVVSDNAAEPAAGLTRETVSGLIAGALDAVEAVVAALRPMSARLREHRREPPGLPELLDTARFTTTQRRRLRRLLRRWSVVLPDDDPVGWAAAAEAPDAGHILAAIDDHLDGVAPSFGEQR